MEKENEMDELYIFMIVSLMHSKDDTIERLKLWLKAYRLSSLKKYRTEFSASRAKGKWRKNCSKWLTVLKSLAEPCIMDTWDRVKLGKNNIAEIWVAD